jgi:hypothetical protein
MLITIFTRAFHYSLFPGRSIQSIEHQLTSVRSILTSTHLRLVFLVLSFLLAFPSMPCMYSSSSSYMSCPSHPSLLKHSNYTWQRVQVMKVFNIELSQTSSLYSRSALSTSLSLCSPLNDREQVSQPYKTIGKRIVLYILIH